MSLYSLYSILFLTFTVVFIIGFLFVSCCKDTTFLRHFRSLFFEVAPSLHSLRRLIAAQWEGTVYILKLKWFYCLREESCVQEYRSCGCIRVYR